MPVPIVTMREKDIKIGALIRRVRPKTGDTYYGMIYSKVPTLGLNTLWVIWFTAPARISPIVIKTYVDLPDVITEYLEPEY
jgi:hypothetical protein